MGRPAHSAAYVAERRERILDGALALFTSQGVEAVSLRALAEGVGLSPMALYRYFPDGKREVLAAVRARGFAALAAGFAAAARATRHPVGRVLALAMVVVRLAISEPDLYRLMFEVAQPELETLAGEAIGARRREAWTHAREAFATAVARGMLHGDPDLLPHVFFAGIHGVVEFELSRQPDPDRNVARLLKPMLRTLLAGSGASAASLRRVDALRLPTGDTP